MIGPICLLRTLYRSIKCGAWVSGCEFETAHYQTPPNVHVTHCRNCGSVSVSWGWDSLEGQK